MVLGLLNMSDEYIDALDIDVIVVDECDQFKVIEASPEFLAPDSEIPQGQDVTFVIIVLPKYSGVGAGVGTEGNKSSQVFSGYHKC